jgi:hypothetical protein
MKVEKHGPFAEIGRITGTFPIGNVDVDICDPLAFVQGSPVANDNEIGRLPQLGVCQQLSEQFKADA